MKSLNQGNIFNEATSILPFASCALLNNPIRVKHYLLFLSVLLLSFAAQGSGIRGHISSESNEALPFATIFVKNNGSGATSNAEGYYEIRLAPGTYDLVFQYYGYQAVTRTVQITHEFLEVNIQMKIQVFQMREVEIHATKEDPAYTIMRKAIAKAKYHTHQIDTFTAQVYMKGSGRLKNSPFFLRKKLREEGIDSTFAFVSESVSRVSYRRPNVYSEQVISVRSSGDDNNTSPNAYINGSFYAPTVAEAVSPLSPRAFSYYKFEYLGTYRDRGYEVSKIRVTPRSQGDNVFKGTLHIVENLWSIHSLSLSTVKYGFEVGVHQIYAPLEDQAWLPVSHRIHVDAKVFGFDFEYTYLATVSDYKISLNPELEPIPELVDEKVEKELAKEIEKASGGMTDVQERLATGKEVTRKEFRTLIKEYEKNEEKAAKEPQVVSYRTFKIDSLAYRKDSVYWETIRPVPLNKHEMRGYVKMDSLSEVQKREREGDTLRTAKRKKGFQPQDILFGDRFKVGEKAYISIEPVLNSLNFNTIEGANFNYHLHFSKTFSGNRWLKAGPIVRYGFSSRQTYGLFRTEYAWGKPTRRSYLWAEGGKFVQQYNWDEPIHPLVNSMMSLLGGYNYMKLYERDLVQLRFRKRVSDKVNFQAQTVWEQRNELFNQTNYTVFNRNRGKYTENAPVGLELPDTEFDEHQAWIMKAKVEWRPWIKYNVRNGRKYVIQNSSPTFHINYTAGIPSLFGSDVSYQFAELGIKHYVKLGVRGKIDYFARGGYFFSNSSMYFMDYKHFLGNLTPFLTTDPVTNFRMLDYYSNSTSEYYTSLHAYYQFRKLLVTRIPLVRLTGVRENLTGNYLYTPGGGHYNEFGYTIDYIFRIFRLEGVTAFQNGKYQGLAFRIGIATNLDKIISIN
jgi:hypothetical protein